MSEWTPHYGGPNPYAGKDRDGNALPQPDVRVLFRSGRPSRDVLRADKWRWKWGVPFPRDDAFDIVGHRKEAA